MVDGNPAACLELHWGVLFSLLLFFGVGGGVSVFFFGGWEQPLAGLKGTGSGKPSNIIVVWFGLCLL